MPRNMVSMPTEKSARSWRLPAFSKICLMVCTSRDGKAPFDQRVCLIPRQFLRHGFLPKGGKADIGASSIAQESW